VHALLDDAEIKYRFEAPRHALRVGQPLLVTASALQGPRLLRMLDRVEVTWTTPGASIGRALARSRHQLAAAPSDPDLGSSPFGRKLLAAFADPSWARSLEPATATTPLRDDGTGGDGTARDGLFTAALGTPTVPGHYQLRFRMQGRTGDGRTFVRKESFSVVVKIGLLDAGRSRIRLITAEGRSYVVLEPQDSAGNLLGPGYAAAIHAEAAGTRLVLEDTLDGRYRAPLPAGFGAADPVRIRFDGHPVHDGTVATPGLTERLPWWIWLLVLLLLLAVVWLLLRR
jgi:hypothetical protein